MIPNVFWLILSLYIAKVQVCNSKFTSYKGIEFEFSPNDLEQIVESEIYQVNVTVNNENQTQESGNILFKAVIQERDVARLRASDLFSLQGVVQNGNHSYPVVLFETLEVEALRLGFATLKIFAKPFENGEYSKPSDWEDTDISCDISVVRRRRVVDKIFMLVIYGVIIFVNVALGCKIDLSVIKANFKKPISPVIALFCQFVFMPLTCFAVINIMKLEGNLALGLLAIGCAPGGGNSNMYCHLLDGNLSLSATLTICSYVLSLGFTTMWLLTLGQSVIKDEGRVRIPFYNILISLSIILVPICIGFLIKVKKPHLAIEVAKFLKIIFTLLLVVIITIGIYSNLFVFQFFTAKMCFSVCFLPYSGFIVGAFISWLCRQPGANVIAVAVETGIQNVGFSIVLLQLSLPFPDCDIAIVGPALFFLSSQSALWIIIIIYYIKNKLCPSKSIELEEMVENDQNGHDETCNEYEIPKPNDEKETADLTGNYCGEDKEIDI